MVIRIRNYALLGLGIFVFYYLLSHHFIFTSTRDFDVLKKNELTLKYTFISAKQASPETLLRVDSLRDGGLEDILLDRGMISEKRLDRILDKIDAEEESELED